ncbi:hypothetical protein [Candidatus Nitrosacidococcus sp. I8]|nr:hypothetical protein [Candidatus Nitrosacidococcus sp. I8]CAH9019179.1 hypothetical protein NURINAE_01378 [Candidatus Nitrosacidococcus sp. I8]
MKKTSKTKDRLVHPAILSTKHFQSIFTKKQNEYYLRSVCSTQAQIS